MTFVFEERKWKRRRDTEEGGREEARRQGMERETEIGTRRR
jgi:hypothetical protein